MTIKGMSPQFLVKDLEHSIAFYTQKLGFDIAFRYEDFYAGITRDGHSIHLKASERSTSDRQGAKENFDLDIVFRVDNIDTIYEELVNKPVEIIQPLCDRPYGREFYIADLDGHVLAFLE